MLAIPFIRRSGVAGGMSLLALILLSAPALAGVSWCRADPIVLLDGVKYQIIVSVPEQNVQQIDDALLFKFTTRSGSTNEVLFLDAGFNGHGEEVEFESHRSVVARMYLDVKHNGDKFPVVVDIYKNGQLAKTVEGTSDTVITALP